MAEERKEGYHWLSPSTIVYCDQQMLKRFPHAVPIPSPDELAMLQRKAAALDEILENWWIDCGPESSDPDTLEDLERAIERKEAIEAAMGEGGDA